MTLNDGRQCAIYAVQLAMSQTLQEEESIKKNVLAQGFQCCVTEVGGDVSAWREKAIRNTIGSSLSNKVIEKKSEHVHALVHALAEAEKGILLDAPLMSNLAVKIGVVRCSGWICVSAFGDCAIHMLSHHDRLGFGMMHIC